MLSKSMVEVKRRTNGNFRWQRQRLDSNIRSLLDPVQYPDQYPSNFNIVSIQIHIFITGGIQISCKLIIIKKKWTSSAITLHEGSAPHLMFRKRSGTESFGKDNEQVFTQILLLKMLGVRTYKFHRHLHVS